jgi:hypothetical protein
MLEQKRPARSYKPLQSCDKTRGSRHLNQILCILMENTAENTMKAENSARDAHYGPREVEGCELRWKDLERTTIPLFSFITSITLFGN